MKLNLAQIIEARDALTRLASEKYPANIAYRIQRNLRAIEPEAATYHKTREDLIKTKYGAEIDPKDRPGIYQVLPEKVNEFTAEIALLLEEDVDINIMTITLECMHEISPIDLMAIEWMIEPPTAITEEKPDRSYRESHRVRKRSN